jgi:hypothetical protein
MDTTRRFLDLSTAHLPHGVCEHLSSYDGVLADRHRYGWWLFVPCEPERQASDSGDDIPDDVLRIQRYARERDCDWIRLDEDASTISDLPTWDW